MMVLNAGDLEELLTLLDGLCEIYGVVVISFYEVEEVF
jgi:hypothetical protein